jgi:predicted HAD superfamily Cof-like phosphohydrolase
MSVFTDQKLFMDTCGQEPSSANELLYYNLIKEEVGELIAAWEVNDRVEIVDALMDIMYVTIGMAHSMGLNPQPFWDEVQRSNMSKFFLEPTGYYTCLRRPDGKILKPDTYSPPNLEPIYKEQCGE